jgi:hypothetical protein
MDFGIFPMIPTWVAGSPKANFFLLSEERRRRKNVAACSRRRGLGPVKGFPTFELHPQFG